MSMASMSRSCLPIQVGNDNFAQVLAKLRGPDSPAIAEWAALQEHMRPLARAASMIPPAALRFGEALALSPSWQGKTDVTEQNSTQYADCSLPPPPHLFAPRSNPHKLCLLKLGINLLITLLSSVRTAQ